MTTLRVHETPEERTGAEDHPFVGLWVTADGNIRQRLLPNGRYVEARGQREAAYTGAYRVDGAMIYYRDDSGFSADGEFRDDVLYHAGMVMHRRVAPGDKDIP